MNILDFRQMKKEKRKISMVTCYDHWSAKIIEQSAVDCVLVGDSVAMVMHGHPTTLQATPEMMSLHTAAVARGLNKKFLVADMPFLSYRKDLASAMDCAGELMRAGASSVKLEGVWGHEAIIANLVGSGIPVMGHLGLTPQSIHQFGGFRLQGREEGAARDLVLQAKKLEELGCFAVVLECIPAPLAREITEELSIPTIGIGGGVDVDGQVLVLQDLLGASPDFNPKFLKKYSDLNSSVLTALNQFHKEVADRSFPTEKESYL